MTRPREHAGAMLRAEHEEVGDALKRIRLLLIEVENRLSVSYGVANRLTLKASRAILHVEQLRGWLDEQSQKDLPEYDKKELFALYYGEVGKE